jgi:hypothetical protein
MRMSLSEVFRNRYYDEGFVYIAGSQSQRLIKIGTTKDASGWEDRERNRIYGGVPDWKMLHYVWLEADAGNIEHAARRRLRRYRVLRDYKKDGRWQRGREMVQCDFSVALDALNECIGDRVQARVYEYKYRYLFDFGRMEQLEHEAEAQRAEEAKTPFDFVFLTRVDDLPLSIRSGNCLRSDGIVYVGDLVQQTEAGMLRTPNFGRKSLGEIKNVLPELGLRLGMELRDWPPDNPEESRKLRSTYFAKKVLELSLSDRSENCLHGAEIVYIGQLVQRTEAEMLRMPNIGRKVLNEINEALAALGLHFGMDIPAWPIRARQESPY